MLNEKYNPCNTEESLSDKWERANVYRWRGGNDFVIDTPPPTISGILHIGHIFSYCHTDFIGRYKRMSGKDVFYPMGFDDNGLPTERLVEKKHKVRAYNMDKEKFKLLCKQVSAEHRKEFRDLFTRIGLSIDWDLEYHTISNDCRILSQMSFLDLYCKDEVYHKEQPMLWDPIDQTAIAHAEIEEKEFSSYMNYLRFGSEREEDFIVATTRPELLPACVAVFVHPDDGRYRHLAGKMAITPLFEIKVPIIADENVKINKGSGAVMCCTFGDELDIYWWKIHSLPVKIIVNKYGKIDYLDQFITDKKLISVLSGLKIKDARGKIIELLSDYLERREEITHQIKCAERSGSPLEILPTKQWFVKLIEHKEELLIKAKRCNWYPAHRRIIIEQWIENLNWDWCISRQRYFGIHFPVWYSRRKGEEGKVLLADVNQLPVDPTRDLPVGYTRKEVIPESDVMDTWATSSISTQLNAKWLNNDYFLPDSRDVFPASLRPQAHEIIRTWAFYTIAKSHLHNNSIPWENLMISGWCLAEDKSKMSKSKGNIIEPNNLLKKYGADIVRYWASHSSLGADTVYSENIMKMGKRLITKLWNAAKFVSGFIVDDFVINLITSPIDLWIVGKLNHIIDVVTEKLENFEYCEARQTVEGFFWRHYCDDYLELIKNRAYNKDLDGHESASHTLSYTFESILRLFAPFIPFITEEIYNNLYSCFSIHRKGNWPKVEKTIEKKYLDIGSAAASILSDIRQRKSSDNVSIKKSVNFTIETNCTDFAMADYDIKSATNAEKLDWQNSADEGDVYVRVKNYRYV
ncbi:MAG: valine--tRNA ligase [Rickettsiaceae bacterium H1]|nr:valine--tRNA ligase [Rickettsiaceae bacterium H1]